MIVVDTNIIFPLFIQSERTEDAIRLRMLDPVWVTEPFALIEFTNVLATYWRTGLVTRDKALEYLTLAEIELAPNIVSVPHSYTLEMAMQYRVTAYDARFLAVAKASGKLLITEDTKLRKSAPNLTQSLDQALKSLS
jgi:predicted nucleic acid-binding protein